MKLHTQTITMVTISMLLVVSSIVLFRWSLISKVQLQQEQEMLESTQQEIIGVKKNIEKFNVVSQSLNEDPQVKKMYFDKTMAFQSQFGREGVENINEVLNTVYSGDGFFELNSLSINHLPSKQEKKPPIITLIIEGDKRLVRE